MKIWEDEPVAQWQMKGNKRTNKQKKNRQSTGESCEDVAADLSASTYPTFKEVWLFLAALFDFKSTFTQCIQQPTKGRREAWIHKQGIKLHLYKNRSFFRCPIIILNILKSSVSVTTKRVIVFQGLKSSSSNQL